MASRTLFVGLIVLATAAFVVGTVVERISSGESGHHGEAALPAVPTGESGASAEAGHTQTDGESAATHAKEDPATSTATEEPHADLRPLGIDVEAWPFATLAAVASLTLAAAAWLRPRAVALLTLVAVAMLAFAALAVREVVHQVDIDKSALAVMAAVIAALHLAAAGVGVVIVSRARHPHAGRPGSAGTMPA
jgi:hypothetical protein